MGFVDRIRSMVAPRGAPGGVRGPLDANDPQDAALAAGIGGAALLMRAPRRVDGEDARAYLVARTDEEDPWGLSIDIWRTYPPANGGPAEAFLHEEGIQRGMREDLGSAGMTTVPLFDGHDENGVFARLVAQDFGDGGFGLWTVVLRKGMPTKPVDEKFLRLAQVEDEARAAAGLSVEPDAAPAR